MSERKIDWKLIDIEGLAATLAEADWASETKMIPENDLYSEDGEVREYWASSYNTLKQVYEKLIEQYTKDKI